MLRRATDTYLDRILANTANELKQRMSAQPESALRELIAARSEEPRSLAATLMDTSSASIIAEFKRASPSKGLIAGNASLVEIIPAYIQGGCAAISILTDESYFQGSLADLRKGSELIGSGSDRPPILRKDFVISTYQVLESRAHGADAILLIVAALTDDQLVELQGVAFELGMDALVEVHDETELERAISIEPRIVGINNRDLRTFDVDLMTTEVLAPVIPDGIAVVGESGVHKREDVVRLEQAGVDAVLVGESLMRHADPGVAVRELLGK